MDVDITPGTRRRLSDYSPSLQYFILTVRDGKDIDGSDPEFRKLIEEDRRNEAKRREEERAKADAVSPEAGGGAPGPAKSRVVRDPGYEFWLARREEELRWKDEISTRLRSIRAEEAGEKNHLLAELAAIEMELKNLTDRLSDSIAAGYVMPADRAPNRDDVDSPDVIDASEDMDAGHQVDVAERADTLTSTNSDVDGLEVKSPSSGRPVVPGDLIRDLYLGHIFDHNPYFGHPSAICVGAAGLKCRNLLFSGEVNLSSISGPSGGPLPGLRLEDCEFESPIQLQRASLSELSFKNSILPAIQGESCKIAGDIRVEEVVISSKFWWKMEVDFSSANIDGSFHAGGMSRNGSRDVVTIKLENSRIRGAARIGTKENNQKVKHKESAADNLFVRLAARGISVDAEIGLYWSSFSYIDLFGAKIGANCILQGSTISDDKKEPSSLGILLSKSNIGGYVDFCGVVAQGVDCSDASIGGSIYLYPENVRGRLQRTTLMKWLYLTNTTVRGDVDLRGVLVGSGGVDDGFFAAGSNILGNINAQVWVKAEDGGASSHFYRFELNGTFFVPGMQISGAINFSGAKLSAPSAQEGADGYGFYGHGMKAGGSVVLSGCRVGGEKIQFECDGRIDFSRGTVRQFFAMQDAKIAAKGGRCLDLEMCRVGTGVFLRAEGDVGRGKDRAGLDATGGCFFSGAEIGTVFDADGASLKAFGKGRRGEVALDLSDSEISGPVRLGLTDRVMGGPRPGFQAHGTVLLEHTKIAGGLECGGGCFCALEQIPEDGDKNKDGYTKCLSAIGATISGNVNLGRREKDERQLPYRGFEGAVDFERAVIGGNFDLTGAALQIHGALRVAWGDGKKMALLNKRCLSLHNAKIDGDFIVEDGAKDSAYPKRNGLVDLSGASFNTLRDRQGRGWAKSPEADANARSANTDAKSHRPIVTDEKIEGLQLRLVGCRYERFDEQGMYDDRTKAFIDLSQQRENWLYRQFPSKDAHEEYYQPQNFEQVERVFSETGRWAEAREIATARSRLVNDLQVGRDSAEWKDRMSAALRRGLNRVYGLLFGFGYWKRHAFATLVACLLTGYLLGLLLIDKEWVALDAEESLFYGEQLKAAEKADKKSAISRESEKIIVRRLVCSHLRNGDDEGVPQNGPATGGLWSSGTPAAPVEGLSAAESSVFRRLQGRVPKSTCGDLTPVGLTVEATRPVWKYLLTPTIRRVSDKDTASNENAVCEIYYHPCAHDFMPVETPLGTIEIPAWWQRASVVLLVWVYVLSFALICWLTYKTFVYGYQGPSVPGPRR